MSAIWGVVSALFWGVVLLSVLVFIHEGGHFLSARAFGMRVTEFFLGMPCRFKLSRRSASRGTEVGVTPILLGGYTRICGMEDEITPRTAQVLSYVAKKGRCSYAEIAQYFDCSEDDALSCIATLVDWASLEPYYDEAAGERPNQRDWPAQVQTVRRDDRLLTAYDRGHDFSREGSTQAGDPHALLHDDAQAFLEAERAHTYQGKGFIARVCTLVAGPAINIVLGIALLIGILSIGGVSMARDINTIGSVQPNSLAQRVGIVSGDTISAVDGTSVSTWTEMGQLLKSRISTGNPFSLQVEHEGETRTIEVDPSSQPDQKLLGIYAPKETFYPNPSQALSLSWRYVTMSAGAVVQLLTPTHTAEVVSQSSSVVGISVMASQAASSGLADFLYLMAAISLSLGFMNLIPIPPLDGGKILIEIVQLISRRRVPDRVQVGLSYVGIALAMLLFVFVIRQDVLRFVMGG